MRYTAKLVSAALLAVSLFFTPFAKSEQLTYLPLQLPGQASVAIDSGKARAYIVDLGRNKRGAALLLDGEPILDRLEALGVKELVVSCSHPHLDHMGGIQALFKNPALFFKDAAKTQPRFEVVTFIDDGVTNSLHSIFATALKNNVAIHVAYQSARGRNAYAGISNPGDDVYVENIPYKRDVKAGEHGAAIITKVTLRGEYTVLDFDDAATSAIQRAVEILKGRPDSKIDAFVVPHHGSSYHDVEPILTTLGPKKAIITVNPKNQYGHPAPEILIKLIEMLGAENVLFTGSVGEITLDRTGVKKAGFTAADRASFELFIVPNRLRAERLGHGKDELALYAKLQEIMNRGPSDPPDEAARVPLKPGPAPTDGGTPAALVADDIKTRQTILSRDFEKGQLRNAGETVDAVLEAAHIPGIANVTRDRSRLAVVQDVSTVSSGGTPATLAKLAASYFLPGEEPATDQPLRVDIQYAEGLTDGWSASYTATPDEAKQVATAMHNRSLPKGGMVFLDGGKLFPLGPAGRLAGGTLDVCGTRYCVTPVGDGSPSYLLPFSPTPLFAEVWDKVVRQNIRSFYLSINPTKRFLEAPAELLATVPSDKLLFGTGNPPANYAFNKVVTEGNIENSVVGDILWKADVAFKSASLGADVFTGVATASRPVSIARGDAAELADFDTAPEDRWCRLYWTSGSQRLIADAASKQIRFEGDAVVARSEPMQLSDGRLVEAPSGTWCGGSKVVAQRLQRATNDGMASSDLRELHRLAQIQNFAKWALDNGLRPSPRFEASIEEKLKLAPRKTVPTWTSGIRSKSTTYVEPEKRWTANPWSMGLHISTADLTLDMLSCIKTNYLDGSEKAFKAAGLTKKDGTWYYDDSHKPFFAKWIDEVAKDIASCANGVVLAGAALQEGAEEAIESDGGIAAPIFHIQPIHLHGGVLLGSEKEQRREAWIKDGRIAMPDGRLVLKREGDSVHLWAFDDSHASFGSTGQHVVISNGKIVDLEAADGRIRVLVESKPGAVVRQEARIRTRADGAYGAEWVDVRHSDGAPIAAKAAWLCDQSNDEVCVADMNARAFGKFIGATETDKPALIIETIKPNLWLVDVSVANVRPFLDKERAKTTAANTASRLALMGQYADWGFQDVADELGAELEESIAGEDYILMREYNPDEIYAMGSAAAMYQLLSIAAKDDGPAAFLNGLNTVEKVALMLPPSYSAFIWSLLETTTEARANDFASAPHAQRFAKMRAKYIDFAQRTRALQEGAANPWVDAPAEEVIEEDDGMDR